MIGFFNLYKTESVIGKTGNFIIESGLINGSRVIVRRAPLTARNTECVENNSFYSTLLKSSFISDSFEVVKSSSEIFIVYFDIEGMTLKDFILNKTPDNEMIGDLFLKLSSFLDLMQGLGIIHTGLNPDCIIIDSDLNIKIISLDFCTEIKSFISIPDYRTIEDVKYFAPEQFHVFNRLITYLTDIYGMGGVFYYILTGISLYEEDNLFKLIKEILNNEIISPDDIDTSISKYYSGIVMKMLSKEPDSRYRDIKKMKNDIISAVIGGAEIPDHFDGGGFSKLIFTGKLYSRNAELKTLYMTFNRIQETNRSEMIVINGEAGVGKTSLIKEFREYTFIHNSFFICGECDEYSDKLKPYNCIINLIKSLYYEVINMDDEEKIIIINKIKHAVMGNGQILLDFVPEFKKLIGSQPVLNYLPPEENRKRLELFMDNFFNIFSKDRYSLVIFIDNIQWIDNDSIRLLKIICGDSFNKKLFIIMSIRNSEFEQARKFHSMIEEINKYKLGVIITQMNLLPLSCDAVEFIINDLLSLESNSISKDFIQYIYKNTDGNPFYILQLLKYYQETGTIFKSGVVSDSLNLINGLDGLFGLFELCYKRLSVEARYVIDCASCFFSNYIAEAQLSIVSGISINSVHKELSSSGLIFFDVYSEVYFFQSGFIKDYFHKHLTKKDQANIHKKISDSMPVKDINDILIKTKHILYYKDQIENHEIYLYANYLTTSACKEMQIGSYSDSYLFYKTALELYVKGHDFKNASIATIKIASLEFFIGNSQKVNDLLKIAIGYDNSVLLDKDGLMLYMTTLYDNKQYDKAVLEGERYLINFGVDINIDYKEKSSQINNLINSNQGEFIVNLPVAIDSEILRNVEVMALLILMASSENNADFNKYVIFLSSYTIYSGMTIYGGLGLLFYGLTLIDDGNIDTGRNLIDGLAKFNWNIDDGLIKNFIFIIQKLNSDRERRNGDSDLCEIIFPASIIDGFMLKYTLQASLLTFNMNVNEIEMCLDRNFLPFFDNIHYTWLKDQLKCFSILRDLIQTEEKTSILYSNSSLILYSLVRAYHFDDPVEAIRILDNFKNRKKNYIEDLLLKDEFYFYKAMILSRLYYSGTQYDKKNYLEEIDDVFNHFKGKNNRGNKILIIRTLILKYHLSKFHNDFKVASIILDEIIDFSRGNNLTYYEALGNSLAGDFYKMLGKGHFSAEYYEKSEYLYSLVGIKLKSTKKVITESDGGTQIKSGSILDYLQCFKVSNHEFRVIKFIEEGKSNKEIGSLMFISESTVKKHISNIFKKLNIKNRYELINFYKQIGENGVANTPKDV
ncbi:MAG: hypothetical protein A2015_01285 [Spirochaetes bacterium GWF1_31_7]|nr:MAG: hypothetical protein A2Y29_01480 [Spirochaetes bacterium GWE2_31_10]OHD52015.1 MAG: hypothetical protein A2015_01285 [Spirochaetes bacterium GWF1_31_7]OHD81063.1 MAG: hypothetical protein A2355_11335 [Spirochaetes bacterium RIFOXYB1_FULL_32_8]HBD94768.1 hypothetical protein [Spirochaetia bacterium]HBI39096.1 hypothetical protein [Spirochaetia bacterium]